MKTVSAIALIAGIAAAFPAIANNQQQQSNVTNALPRCSWIKTKYLDQAQTLDLCIEDGTGNVVPIPGGKPPQAVPMSNTTTSVPITKAPTPTPPPVTCGQPAAPEEMRAFCTQAFLDGTLDLNEVPDCKGWYTIFTAGVLPANAKCETPPAPSPTPAGCPSPDDLFLNPLSPNSPHRRRVASFASSNDRVNQTLQRLQFTNINSNDGWGINVYETDGCAIPADAQAGGGRDAYLLVMDRRSGQVNEFYHFGKSDQLQRKWDARGDGVGVGLSASNVAGFFGLMRGAEVNTPGCPLNHAHQIAIDKSALQSQTVYPATNTDWFCKSGCNGGIPYGTWLAIPPDAQLPQLSEPGQRLAKSLQEYGMYVVDQGPQVIRADQYVRGDVRAQLNSDMRKLWPLLRHVASN